MSELIISHSFVRKLATNIRAEYGKDIKHTQAINLIAKSLGWNGDALMHKLKNNRDKGSAEIQTPAAGISQDYLVDGIMRHFMSHSNDEDDKKIWSNKARHLLSASLPLLEWECGRNGGEITYMALRRSVSLGAISSWLSDPALQESPNLTTLRSYLFSLPGFVEERGPKQSQTTIDQHRYCAIEIARALDKMEARGFPLKHDVVSPAANSLSSNDKFQSLSLLDHFLTAVIRGDMKSARRYEHIIDPNHSWCSLALAFFHLETDEVKANNYLESAFKGDLATVAYVGQIVGLPFSAQSDAAELFNRRNGGIVPDRPDLLAWAVGHASELGYIFNTTDGLRIREAPTLSHRRYNNELDRLKAFVSFEFWDFVTSEASSIKADIDTLTLAKEFFVPFFQKCLENQLTVRNSARASPSVIKDNRYSVDDFVEFLSLDSLIINYFRSGVNTCFDNRTNVFRNSWWLLLHADFKVPFQKYILSLPNMKNFSFDRPEGAIIEDVSPMARDTQQYIHELVKSCAFKVFYQA
ncbi:hypothetical protein [Mesorhizobium sp. SP-1A]|uniref:hypothetical protein n=1 Tax=Mesorhizobium sp. SP-1A TaxID=3077840 RepID=UPI0028F72CFF|nr:hypothetical protein [Mesorhizobium sp. SP-1A]